MDRYHNILKCMDSWMRLREKNISINQYFEYRNIHKIGIYGYGILGRHILWEIEQSHNNISVLWVLDKRANDIKNSSYPIFLPEDISSIKTPELVIVSAINDFEEIEAFICERLRVPVISVNNIVDECYQKE